jgi:hypothetical protein
MFKVKRRKDGKLLQVLDTYFDDLFQTTYFLIWEGGWFWYDCRNFVPPNVDGGGRDI